MNNQGIQIEFAEKNESSLSVTKRRISLDGNEKGAYLTVDIYPEHKPRRPARHFGTWQFPMEKIASREIEISIEPQAVTLYAGGEKTGPSNIIKGRMKENVLYRVNLVIHDKDFNVLAENSYFQIIAEDARALDAVDFWPGSSQRSPGLTDPAYLSLKCISEMICGFIAGSGISGESRVLDAGCAHKPYYPCFAVTDCEYVGTDIFDGQFVDRVRKPGESWDFEAESFDFVISTQVLEHTPDPRRLVAETFRVLKPGGKVFFSTPFAWETHDYPADYWRFPEAGLRLLFAEFSDAKISPAGNTAQCLLELRNLSTHRNRRPGLCSNTVICIRNWIGKHISKASPDNLMPSNYIVTATK